LDYVKEETSRLMARSADATRLEVHLQALESP
jgi:hypothetical protein